MIVLVVNCGSSTIKWSLFEGEHGSQLTRLTAASPPIAGDRRDVFEEMRRQLVAVPDLIAHRMVHGGRLEPGLLSVSPDVLEALELATELAPLHNQAALEGIRLGAAFQRPQVVAFDSAFHRTLPAVASRYPIPSTIPVRRLGFHGWSHQNAMEQYSLLTGSTQPTIITLHLGSGCSATAIRQGRSVDTSMGFTPLEGLMMGSRAGDLDPGVITYLLHQGVSADEIDRLLNRESGLRAVAGTSDMRELLARKDAEAQLAIEMFCYHARKYVGAYLAVLDGAEALVFTGGIGEHATEIRRRICEPMEWAGLKLDPARNACSEQRISADGARLTAWVVPADEERIIAREALRLLGRG